MSDLTRFEGTGGLEAFLDSYVECALWSSHDESDELGGDPMDANYGPQDIDARTLAAMRADCAAFCASNARLLAKWDAGIAGHDFWLTRNGHGAGFWDRGNETGDALTDATKAGYNVADLYVGDDGRIYQAGAERFEVAA